MAPVKALTLCCTRNIGCTSYTAFSNCVGNLMRATTVAVRGWVLSPLSVLTLRDRTSCCARSTNTTPPVVADRPRKSISSNKQAPHHGKMNRLAIYTPNHGPLSNPSQTRKRGVWAQIKGPYLEPMIHGLINQSWYDPRGLRETDLWVVPRLLQEACSLSKTTRMPRLIRTCVGSSENAEGSKEDQRPVKESDRFI